MNVSSTPCCQCVRRCIENHPKALRRASITTIALSTIGLLASVTLLIVGSATGAPLAGLGQGFLFASAILFLAAVAAYACQKKETVPETKRTEQPPPYSPQLPQPRHPTPRTMLHTPRLRPPPQLRLPVYQLPPPTPTTFVASASSPMPPSPPPSVTCSPIQTRDLTPHASGPQLLAAQASTNVTPEQTKAYLKQLAQCLGNNEHFIIETQRIYCLVSKHSGGRVEETYSQTQPTPPNGSYDATTRVGLFSACAEETDIPIETLWENYLTHRNDTLELLIFKYYDESCAVVVEQEGGRVIGVYREGLADSDVVDVRLEKAKSTVLRIPIGEPPAPLG